MIRTAFFMSTLVLTTIHHTFWVLVIGLFKPISPLSLWFFKNWSRIVMGASGCKLIVEGTENIDPEQPYIAICNHQSNMDIPAIVAALPQTITIIAKKELFDIPVFAQGMRAVGILKIDRGDRKKALNALRDAAKVIRERKVTVLAFPEGTRSRDGKIKPFKKGAFVLAIETGIPILPITMSGTYPIIPSGTLKVNPGIIKVTIHPPIKPEAIDYEARNKLIQKTHDVIESGYQINVTEA